MTDSLLSTQDQADRLHTSLIDRYSLQHVTDDADGLIAALIGRVDMGTMPIEVCTLWEVGIALIGNDERKPLHRAALLLALQALLKAPGVVEAAIAEVCRELVTCDPSLALVATLHGEVA